MASQIQKNFRARKTFAKLKQHKHATLDLVSVRSKGLQPGAMAQLLVSIELKTCTIIKMEIPSLKIFSQKYF